MTNQCKWGQTPLDDLSHAELLLVAKRLYAAAIAAGGAMKVIAKSSPEYYWTAREGAGAIALEKCKQAINAVDGKRVEPAYLGFYRYANHLLFDSTNFNTGNPWFICPECGRLISPILPATMPPEASCDRPGCEGTYRPMTWDDLKVAP